MSHTNSHAACAFVAMTALCEVMFTILPYFFLIIPSRQTWFAEPRRTQNTAIHEGWGGEGGGKGEGDVLADTPSPHAGIGKQSTPRQSLD